MQNAIRYYKKEEFQALSKQKRIEQIHKINQNSFGDREILRKWEEHFQKVGVCYCIVKNKINGEEMLSLWKERYV